MVNSQGILQRQKILLIPPILVDDKHVTDIKTKANIFKLYFAEQCTLLKSNNVLSINQTLLTQSRLTYLDFNEEEILKIIRTLNIDKSHGQDDFFFRIKKISYKSLLKPLIVFFQNSAKSSYFPDIWKKG